MATLSLFHEEEAKGEEGGGGEPVQHASKSGGQGF